MRVLLAGASGAIGRYLIPQLIAAKHDVIGITRQPGALAETGAREIVADALDRPALLAALADVKADAVIHQLTALSKPPATYRLMRPTNRLRAEGTSNLIAAARQVGAKKFVAASFFGGYGYNDLGPTPLTEHAPFGEPDDRNDAALLALLTLEQQVRAFGGVSLRYGLFYDSTTKGVSPVSRTWDGLIPNVHLKDAAHAVVLALAKYKPGSVYNIADDHSMTYRDREVAQAQASKLKPPQQLPDSIIRIAAPFAAMLLSRTSMSLDSSKARTELGWKPEFESLLKCLGVKAEDLTGHVTIPLAPEPTVTPVPELVEGPDPDSAAGPSTSSGTDTDTDPAPEPAPETAAGPSTSSGTDTVPELVEVPEPVEAPDPDPAPELVEVPEPVEGPDPDPEPADDKAPEPEKKAKEKDPFADIEAAIARIGTKSD